MNANGFLKRLEALAQSISVRRPRLIGILVDGHAEDQSAVDAIVQKLDPKPEDLVICVARFGGKDPDLPRLGGITHF